MASLFKRGEVWWVRYRGVDGRWTQESCGKGIGKAEAEIVRNRKEQIAINMRHKTPIFMVETGLVQAINHYRNIEIPRANEGRRKTPATVTRYQQVIDNFLEYVTAHEWKKFKELTTESLKNFIEYLSETQSPSSIIIHRLELIKFFRWAISQSFIIENPMGDIKNPKIPKRDDSDIVRFFSDSELASIFENSNETYREIFKFLYLTGLRIGELCNAEYTDIKTSWDAHTKENLPRLTIPIRDRSKTKRPTSIPLGEEQIAIINSQKKKSIKVATADAKRYIFINEDGLQLDNANIYRNLKRVLEKCGIANGHPHTFRHTFASHLVMKGVPLYVVSKLLRHASLEETQIYSHISQEVTRDAAEQLSIPKPGFHLRELKFKTAAAANAG